MGFKDQLVETNNEDSCMGRSQTKTYLKKITSFNNIQDKTIIYKEIAYDNIENCWILAIFMKNSFKFSLYDYIFYAKQIKQTYIPIEIIIDIIIKLTKLGENIENLNMPIPSISLQKIILIPHSINSAEN